MLALESDRPRMSPNKHICYVTVSEVQRLAKETIANENDDEFQIVVRKVLERIQWYEAIEWSIREVVPTQASDVTH